VTLLGPKHLAVLGGLRPATDAANPDGISEQTGLRYWDEDRQQVRQTQSPPANSPRWVGPFSYVYQQVRSGLQEVVGYRGADQHHSHSTTIGIDWSIFDVL